MDRVPSADDLMATFLWNAQRASAGTPSNGTSGAAAHGARGVNRTPSQHEMESYYNAMMASAAHGAHAGFGVYGALDGSIAHARDAAGGAGSAPGSREGTPGIPRVASIDVLRKMIMSGGLGGGGGPGGASPGSATPTTAAAFSAFASGANLDALGAAVAIDRKSVV